jgi:hypothetical protein
MKDFEDALLDLSWKNFHHIRNAAADKPFSLNVHIKGRFEMWEGF